MKVAFVTDSGCEHNQQEMKALGIYSLPLQISNGSETILELEDASIEEVYKRVQAGELMKTSLPPLGLIEELFADLKKNEYDTVFAVPICNGLSGTINAMRLAAEENGLTFICMDTYVTAEVQFYCITLAKKLYEEGKSLDEIQTILQAVIDSASTLLIPVDLNHLKRGGRLTPLAATLAGLLKIKPILKIDKPTEGRIDVSEKVRTLSKAMDKAIDLMIANGLNSDYELVVAYVLETADCEDMIQRIQNRVPGLKPRLIELISVVGCHTGIGCIAIQYFKPYKEQ